MALRLPNLKNMLAKGDAKQRAFVLIAGIIILVIVVIFIGKVLRSRGSDDGQAKIASAPNVQSIQGGKVSQEYQKALEQSNQDRAQDAQSTGGSALPTLINTGESAAITTGCTQCCAVCSDENVKAELNKLLSDGKISPSTQALLNKLAAAKVSSAEYAAQLQKLVAEGKLAADQARKLLAAYNNQSAKDLADEAGAAMDPLIKDGELPLDAANDLLGLQKAGASVGAYQRKLQQLASQGKISAATAARLLGQYKKQHADVLQNETKGQLASMVASGEVSPDIAKTLQALQDSNVPMSDYQRALAQMVKDGKISPAEAKRLLAQYKKLHGISDDDADLAKMNNESKLPQAAGDALKLLQSQYASVDDFAAKLQSLVQANTISSDTAAQLLKQYQQEHKAKEQAITQLKNLQAQGSLDADVEATLAGYIQQGDTAQAYDNSVQQLSTDGKLAPDLVTTLENQYQLAYSQAQAKDQMISQFETEKKLPDDAAAMLSQLQDAGASVDDYAAALQELVREGKLSPQEAAALLAAYKAKMAQQNNGDLTGSAVDSSIPQSSAFGAGANTAAGSARMQQLQQQVAVEQAQAQQNRFNAQSAQETSAEQRAAQQAYDQNVQTLSQKMTQQAQQLITGTWTPAPQAYVEGDETADAAGSGGDAAAGKGAEGDKGPPIIKAGTVFYGVIETAVNSDYADSPLMATIVSGPYKGAKLLGKIQTVKNGQRVLLQFNLMTMDKWPRGKSVDAYAIDPDTARSALATSVNNHYLLRYGTLFASSFLEGMAEAITESGTTVTSDSGVVTSSTDDLSTEQKVLVALGQVGEDASSEMSDLVKTPPTVKVKSGVGVGILFMGDVEQDGSTPDQSAGGAVGSSGSATATTSGGNK